MGGGQNEMGRPWKYCCKKFPTHFEEIGTDYPIVHKCTIGKGTCEFYFLWLPLLEGVDIYLIIYFLINLINEFCFVYCGPMSNIIGICYETVQLPGILDTTYFILWLGLWFFSEPKNDQNSVSLRFSLWLTLAKP